MRWIVEKIDYEKGVAILGRLVSHYVRYLQSYKTCVPDAASEIDPVLIKLKDAQIPRPEGFIMIPTEAAGEKELATKLYSVCFEILMIQFESLARHFSDVLRAYKIRFPEFTAEMDSLLLRLRIDMDRTFGPLYLTGDRLFTH